MVLIFVSFFFFFYFCFNLCVCACTLFWARVEGMRGLFGEVFGFFCCVFWRFFVKNVFFLFYFVFELLFIIFIV